eukprot:m.81328 g.81328  ORF g.81328 m.81328 type:complete len:323 (+) comp12631_c1_seq5:101-1069(+)
MDTLRGDLLNEWLDEEEGGHDSDWQERAKSLTLSDFQHISEVLRDGGYSRRQANAFALLQHAQTIPQDVIASVIPYVFSGTQVGHALVSKLLSSRPDFGLEVLRDALGNDAVLKSRQNLKRWVSQAVHLASKPSTVLAIETYILRAFSSPQINSIAGGILLSGIYNIHGMDNYAKLRMEADSRDPVLPKYAVSQDTADKVRIAFLDRKINPAVYGGYIDFLEAANLPVDPTDSAVKLPELNIYPGQYGDIDWAEEYPSERECLEALHSKRLATLNEDWVRMNQLKRAIRVSGTLTKAVFVIIAYYIVLFISTKVREDYHLNL